MDFLDKRMNLPIQGVSIDWDKIDDGSSLIIVANAYERMGKRDRAISCYRRALDEFLEETGYGLLSERRQQPVQNSFPFMFYRALKSFKACIVYII